jgi:hypothetical protein
MVRLDAPPTGGNTNEAPELLVKPIAECDRREWSSNERGRLVSTLCRQVAGQEYRHEKPSWTHG